MAEEVYPRADEYYCNAQPFGEGRSQNLRALLYDVRTALSTDTGSVEIPHPDPVYRFQDEYKIPLLPDTRVIPQCSINRYIVVALSIPVNNVCVKFAIDKTDLCVKGYCSQRKSCFFKVGPHEAAERAQQVWAMNNVFRADCDGRPGVQLMFGGKYDSLLATAYKARESTTVGSQSMENAILTLYRDHETSRKSIARRAQSLYVVTQMVSEALRCLYYEDKLCWLIDNGKDEPPNGLSIDIQNSWGHYSDELQGDYISANDEFQNPIFITDDDEAQTVMQVRNKKHKTIAMLAILKHR